MYKLNKNNHVYDDGHERSAKFAKEYVAAHKGDYRPMNKSVSNAVAEKEGKAQERFWDTYDQKRTRHGYGGSGTTVYTHKQTGHKFEVNKHANGRGFDGTDHVIKHIKESYDVVEAVGTRSPYHVAGIKVKSMALKTRNKDDSYQLHLIANYLQSIHPKNHKTAAQKTRRLDTELRDQVSDHVHDNSSAEHSAAFHKNAGLKRLKEQTEPLDELSQKTLRRYAQKADKDRADSDYNASILGAAARGESGSRRETLKRGQAREAGRVVKRLKGIALAGKKMAEAVETMKDGRKYNTMYSVHGPGYGNHIKDENGNLKLFDSKEAAAKAGDKVYLHPKTGRKLYAIGKSSMRVHEGINVNKASMGDVIDDFQQSDAPQFKGKSKAKRRQMAIAAKLATEALSAADNRLRLIAKIKNSGVVKSGSMSKDKKDSTCK